MISIAVRAIKTERIDQCMCNVEFYRTPGQKQPILLWTLKGRERKLPLDRNRHRKVKLYDCKKLHSLPKFDQLLKYLAWPTPNCWAKTIKFVYLFFFWKIKIIFNLEYTHIYECRSNKNNSLPIENPSMIFFLLFRKKEH